MGDILKKGWLENFLFKYSDEKKKYKSSNVKYNCLIIYVYFWFLKVFFLK